MLKAITRFSLNAPKLILLGAALAFAVACWIARSLPVDVFPELKVPRVVIQTEAGGLTAEEVEQLITVPLESSMNGIPGVRSIRSSSGGGLSFVWIDFDWGTDLMKARYSVSERLDQVRTLLPAEAEPEITPVVSVTGEIAMLALTSPTHALSPLALRQLGEYDLRNRLLAIPGVGQVVVIGGSLPEFRIGVSQNRLTTLGLTLPDIIEAARQTRTMAGAGYLANVGGREIPLRQTARADSLAEIKNAIIPAGARQRLTIGQAASVTLAGAPRRGSASYEGRDAVLLAVQKTPGGNTLEITKEIDKTVADFRASKLPSGVFLHADAYRQADFIGVSIKNGGKIARDAVFIVIAVLILTLLSVRTTLIVLTAMPFSFAFGMLLFPALGLGVNIMTLGGLAVAVGDVVDNAIIFVEITWRRLQENRAKEDHERLETKQVIWNAFCEVFPSVTFSTVLIALVFVPLLFLSGLEGQFFRPLGESYLLVFGGSLLVAITAIPALCLLLGKSIKARKSQSTEAKPVRWMKKIYGPIVHFCIRRPIVVTMILVAGTVLCLALASTFGSSFLAPFKEDCFTVFVNTPPGTSLHETERVALVAEREIRKIDGVLRVARKTGRAEKDEHAEPVSSSELLVRVDMKKDPRKIREEISSILNAMPGLSTMIGYPIAHRISAVLSGTEAELAINIVGDDLPILRATVVDVKKELDKIPQIADVRANREIMVETLRIQYRPHDLARFGLTYQEAGEQVSAAMNGLRVGQVAKNIDRWDVVVRLEDAERDTIKDIGDFRIQAADGSRPMLREIADVYREEASNLIIRDQGRRKALISCNVAADSNPGDVVEILKERVEPIARRHGCSIEYGGSYEAQKTAAARLAWLSAGLLAIIVLLLTKATESFRRALLVLLNIPICLAGSIIAVFLAAPGAAMPNLMALLGGGHYVPPILSVASLVGAVTVAGFVLRSGLLLVNRYRELEHEGMTPEAAILEGSKERLVPILMTSLTTVLGLLPLIWAAEKPGGELLAPLAVVQFGGLISATVLSLIAIPAAAMLLKTKQK